MEKKKMPLWVSNLILLGGVAVLSFAPLFMAKDAAFEGADGQAKDAITELATDYEPWFEPLIEPASGEIESLLFALQAALGAGVLAYGFGYLHGKSKNAREVASNERY